MEILLYTCADKKSWELVPLSFLKLTSLKVCEVQGYSEKQFSVDSCVYIFWCVYSPDSDNEDRLLQTH